MGLPDNTDRSVRVSRQETAATMTTVTTANARGDHSRPMTATMVSAAIAAIVVTSVYDIAQGTALLLQDQGWLILDIVTTCLAILQLAYAIALRKRGVLR